MSDLVPVITPTPSVPETQTPAVIFKPVERHRPPWGSRHRAREPALWRTGRRRYSDPGRYPEGGRSVAARDRQARSRQKGSSRSWPSTVVVVVWRWRSLLEAGDIDEDYPVRTLCRDRSGAPGGGGPFDQHRRPGPRGRRHRGHRPDAEVETDDHGHGAGARLRRDRDQAIGGPVPRRASRSGGAEGGAASPFARPVCWHGCRIARSRRISPR